MADAQNRSRWLLATAGLLPTGGKQVVNETFDPTAGAGHQCAGFKPTDPNNTLYDTWYRLNCISTFTVDSQIFLTMWTTAAVGALCLAVFCWGQSFVSVYRGRLLSPSVAIKPPVFNNRGFFAKYFAWLWVSIAMSENELLATAGMDALMFERLIIFCLQFMFPVMVIAVSTLIPIHLNSKFLADNTSSGQQFAKSNLMALTMGSLEPEAKTLWVHFSFVFLFTAYGMWLLDQHYKSYVLLRQRYLTHGDSVSAWLGSSKIKTRPLASYGSVLLDQPTQQELYNPLWTFARAKASDSDAGTQNPPSTATSLPAALTAAAAASAAVSLPAVATAPAGLAAAATSDGPAGVSQHSPALARLETLQRDGDMPASPAQKQQRSPTRALAHTLCDAGDSAYVLSPAASAAAQAAASPFAGPDQHGVLQERPTLQMVQLSDIIIPAQSELPKLQPLQQAAGGHAAEVDLPERSAAPSPCDSNGAAGSQLVSRQSSGRALLTSRHVDSSSTVTVQEEEHQKQASGPFGFLHRGSREHKSHSGADPPSAAASASEQLQSADGAVSHGGGTKMRRCLSGCAPGCAPGGCSWRRLDCRDSTDDEAPAVTFVQNDSERELEREREREQRRIAIRAREKAAARRAAEILGVDVEWWQYKTGDLLIDRHIVQVNMDKELGSAGQSPDKPFYWWELAPLDAFSAAGENEASNSGAGSNSAAGAGSSNLLSVPNTSLLFDKRSLRARRPSVRFRNTVHVKGHDDKLVPLHVSNYAVLVTDVPDLPRLQRSLSDRSSSSCGQEFGPGTSCCGPFAEACAGLLDLLDHALQFVCWGWPCLLSRAELRDYAKGWIQLSFKTAQQMSFASRQAADAEELRMEQLEAGALLQDADGDKGAAQLASAPEQLDMQPQRQRMLASRTLQGKSPITRQALVEATFKQLFPDDVQAVIPAQEYKAVNELLREWNRKVQVYIHAVALRELKHKRQQRKRQTLRREQAAAAGDAAAVGNGAATDAQQVCIEVTSMHDRGAPMGPLAKAAAAAASPTASGSGAGKLTSIVESRSATERASFVGASSCSNSNTGAIASSKQGPQAPQQASMARPGHTRNSSACESDADLSDSEDELGCCAATMRRVCCCACCGVGAIQDGGHGLLPPHGDVGMEGARGASGCKQRCWRLFGRHVEDDSKEVTKSAKDLMEEKRQELFELEAQIIEEQRKVLAGPDTGNFMVLFKTPQAANLAAHSTVYPDSGEGEPFKVQPAPSPEDVLWPSLWASPADRRSVLGIVSFWYGILFLIPTGFFAASLNAVNLTLCAHKNSPSAGVTRSFDWFCHSQFMQFLVTIVAPYILLIVWQNAVIPSNMYRLELRRAVAVSLSQMERRLLLVYCGWELTNIFLGGVLSGSLVSQVQVFFENPEKWAQVLGAAIPQTSNFFLNYVITRAFMLNLVRLLMPHGGMWRWLGQMLFTGFTGFRHAATASYRACIIYPASIRYGREPGLVLLILLIGMAYCVAAPLITVFVFAYMVTAYVVWRYQIIYVCVRAYESGGKMWPTYFLCIEYCLGFFVAFTSAMLIFKKANMQGVLVLLLLPALYLFNRRCRLKYRTKVDNPPLWLAHQAPRSEIDPLVYLPPCLQPNAQGWFFEAGKPWIRWGVPSYNNPKNPGHDEGGCCC